MLSCVCFALGSVTISLVKLTIRCVKTTLLWLWYFCTQKMYG